MMTAFAMLLAALLDAWLGEPRQWHPLVLFGRLSRFIEQRCHADRRGAGVLAWALGVLPLVAVTWLLAQWLGHLASWLSFALDVIVLYLVIGLRSLADH